MANNKEIAHQILTAVGGASNLKDATHCMTRLRLYLKDDSIPKDEEVKAIGGVLGVVRGGQQYQVIIGTNVPKVYEELCKLANLTANAPVEDAKAAAEDAAVAKPKLTPKQVGKNIMGYMAGCMTPLIPVLLAGALFRCINSLCGPELLELYPAESDLYILFDFLYDAAFYFMPPSSWASPPCWAVSSAVFSWYRILRLMLRPGNHSQCLVSPAPLPTMPRQCCPSCCRFSSSAWCISSSKRSCLMC